MDELSVRLELDEAIANYDRIEVNNLLKSFPDIVRGSDILHTSVQYQRDDEAFGIFLDLHGSGANPLLVDDQGNTVLHQLCWEKFIEAPGYYDEEIIRVLIKDGVRINSRNEQQLTPLWIASAWFREDRNKSIDGNFLECCLIEYGANINYGNAQNVTPLHLAVIHDDLPYVQFLICCGANLNSLTISDDEFPNGRHSNAKIKKGSSPLDLCSSAEIRELLLNAGGRPGNGN
jgi:ankyrin repeat protein